MLADSTEMTQGLFRMLAGAVDGVPTAAGRHLDSRTRSSESRQVPKPPSPQAPVIRPLERARQLREHPLLGQASLDQLLALVAVGDEIPLRSGQVLFHAHHRPAVFHILAGGIRLEHDTALSTLAGPGTTTGVEETLAGLSQGRRAVVTSDGFALRIDRDTLFEVLAEHSSLLQGLFSGVLHTRRLRLARPAAAGVRPPLGGLPSTLPAPAH
jgi:hypothetical protein